MNAGGSVMGSGLIKALTVVCLLAGVFAMHGLTSQHDALLAARHTTAGRPGIAHHAEAAGHERAQIVRIAAAGDADDHPEDLCLAVMTVLALALAGVAVRRWSVVTGNRRLAATIGVHPLSWPPWVPLSLSRLCVLRI
ncbi:DUF6153 family protein [Kribbella sp. NPDC004138]